MDRITGAFLADAPLKLEALREAVADDDAESVAMVAHTLKGGCWYVGARRLAELCAALEEAAGAGNLTDAGSSVAGLEAELESLREAMGRALQADS